MIKKLISNALVAAMIVSTLCGCNETSNVTEENNQIQVETPSVSDQRLTDGRSIIGISMPDQLLERWNRDGNYLKTEFEKRGYEVSLSFANNLIDKQIEGIRQMIAEGTDLIVISAVDGAALSNVLEEANNAGVKIISYDRLLMDTDVVDYYVSYDNYMVGKLQAGYIIDKLALDDFSDARTIEFISGDTVDNNARYYYNGAMDTLRPYINSGRLKVVSGQTSFYETATSQWSTSLAQQRLQIILNSYYISNQLDAILCANDSTALGAANAIDSDYSHSNKVIITGQDADIGNVYNIIDGKQSMTVFKDLTRESLVTVDLATAILEGKTPDESLIDDSNWDFECKYDTSTYNNGKKVVTSYLLIPMVVDSDNLQQELFDKGYYTINSGGLIVTTE